MVFGFKEDKSKEEVYSKVEVIQLLANGGKFVRFSDTVSVEKRTDWPTQKIYTKAQVKNIFGTDDTSKIFIIALDILNFYVETATGGTYCTQPGQFTVANNWTYDFPRYDLHVDGRLAISFHNPQASGTHNETFRLLAFVAD